MTWCVHVRIRAPASMFRFASGECGSYDFSVIYTCPSNGLCVRVRACVVRAISLAVAQARACAL